MLMGFDVFIERGDGNFHSMHLEMTHEDNFYARLYAINFSLSRAAFHFNATACHGSALTRQTK